MKEVKNKSNIFLMIIFCMIFLSATDIYVKASEIQSQNSCTYSYTTSDWNKTMNTEEKKDEKYPEKRKITPETVRLTVNEYYVPQFSELVEKGVDCFEWLNKLDDPYLNRYKVDVRLDANDERLKLFWKRSF